MSDFSVSDVSARISSDRGARQLGVALLAGVAAVVAFTWWDAGRVKEREQFEEVTAVGDGSSFVAPASGAPAGHAVADAGGKTWRVVNGEKLNLRDTRMVRAARDEARGLTLYRAKGATKPDELFVKTASNAYLRLAP